MEVLYLEQPILAVIVAFQGNPVHRAFSHLDLFGRVTGEADACRHWILQASTEGCLGFMEIATGDFFFVRRRSDRDAVDFYSRAGGRAGDLKRVDRKSTRLNSSHRC